MRSVVAWYAITLGVASDKFENYLHREVCAGAITLARARHEIATNWVAYWKAAGEPNG